MRNLLLGCVLLAGCAGDPDQVCGPPTGTYRIHYEEQGGNCGPLGDEIAALDGPGSSMNGVPDPVTGEVCNSDVEVTADECRSMGVNVCERTDGSTLRGQAVLDRYEGGALVMGTIQITLVRDGVTICSSLYEVTARRQ